MRALIAILIGVLSTGWILPIYLAANAYLGGFQHLLRGTEDQNSFPFFHFGGQALWIGSMWCLVSAVSWATYGAYRLLAPLKNKQGA